LSDGREKNIEMFGSFTEPFNCRCTDSHSQCTSATTWV